MSKDFRIQNHQNKKSDPDPHLNKIYPQLDIVSAYSDALVEVLVPPREGGGELLFADASQDPIPGRLDRLLGQPELRHPSISFTLGKRN